MNFNLSHSSYRRLNGVDQKIINILELAIRRTPIDFGVAHLGGRRTDEEQNDLFVSGYSQKDGYIKKSKHQYGEAVDLIVFVGANVVNNENMLSVVAGVIFSCASELGIKIRWGLDWDSDGDIRDTKFRDIYHYELIT